MHTSAILWLMDIPKMIVLKELWKKIQMQWKTLRVYWKSICYFESQEMATWDKAKILTCENKSHAISASAVSSLTSLVAWLLLKRGFLQIIPSV